jgi:hypothetical protein
MRVKGYTVHYGADGKSACGVTPRNFLGQPSVNRDVRYVTCPKCQKLIRDCKNGKRP